jgi:hypothetical protein
MHSLTSHSSRGSHKSHGAKEQQSQKNGSHKSSKSGSLRSLAQKTLSKLSNGFATGSVRSVGSSRPAAVTPDFLEAARNLSRPSPPQASHQQTQTPASNYQSLNTSQPQTAEETQQTINDLTAQLQQLQAQMAASMQPPPQPHMQPQFGGQYAPLPHGASPAAAQQQYMPTMPTHPYGMPHASYTPYTTQPQVAPFMPPASPPINPHEDGATNLGRQVRHRLKHTLPSIFNSNPIAASILGAATHHSEGLIRNSSQHPQAPHIPQQFGGQYAPPPHTAPMPHSNLNFNSNPIMAGILGAAYPTPTMPTATYGMPHAPQQHPYGMGMPPTSGFPAHAPHQGTSVNGTGSNNTSGMNAAQQEIPAAPQRPTGPPAAPMYPYQH